MTHLLKLFVATLKQPRAAFIRLYNEPQWPLLAIQAHWRLSKTAVGAVEFVSHLFPEAELDEIKCLFIEANSTGLRQYLEDKEARMRGKQPRGTIISGTSYDEAEVIYVIVRLSKPNSVVETGVAAGVTSTFILQALDRNNQGELYSIDLVSPGFVEDGLKYWWPAGKESGWMIPDRLRSRWHLVLGRSQHVLVPTLARLGEIDLFLHDSLHTFKNMEFEYQSAWKFIRTGGCLLSHDVTVGYLKFCRGAATLPLHYSKVGGIRKQA